MVKTLGSQPRDTGSTPVAATIKVKLGSPCKKTEQGVTPIGSYLARAQGTSCPRLLQVLPYNEPVGSE